MEWCIRHCPLLALLFSSAHDFHWYHVKTRLTNPAIVPIVGAGFKVTVDIYHLHFPPPIPDFLQHLTGLKLV